MRVDPPIEIDGEILECADASTCRRRGLREARVVAHGVRSNAFGCELGESCVDCVGEVVVEIVFADEGKGFVSLFGGIEGAVGELVDVDFFVRHFPINLIGGDEVEGPGFGPALPAGVDRLAGVCGVARGEGFEDVKLPPVANCPRCKRKKRQERAGKSDAQEMAASVSECCAGEVQVSVFEALMKRAGANEIPSNAPSGRSMAAAVMAKVKRSAKSQPRRSARMVSSTRRSAAWTRGRER